MLKNKKKIVSIFYFKFTVSTFALNYMSSAMPFDESKQCIQYQKFLYNIPI